MKSNQQPCKKVNEQAYY